MCNSNCSCSCCESARSEKNESDKPSCATQMVCNSLTGAMFGSVLGPVGAAVGFVIGAAFGQQACKERGLK